MLHANIDRKFYRLQRLTCRQANGAKITQPLRIDIFFHSRNALVVDINKTKDVGCSRSTRIKPALFGAKTNTGDAKRHDLALLFGCQTPLDPDKSGTAFKTPISGFPVEIRNDS